MTMQSNNHANMARLKKMLKQKDVEINELKQKVNKQDVPKEKKKEIIEKVEEEIAEKPKAEKKPKKKSKKKDK